MFSCVQFRVENGYLFKHFSKYKLPFNFNPLCFENHFYFVLTDSNEPSCLIQFNVKTIKYHLRFNKYRNYITLDHIQIAWQHFKRIALFTNKKSCAFPLRSVHLQNTSLYWNMTWVTMHNATLSWWILIVLTTLSDRSSLPKRFLWCCPLSAGIIMYCHKSFWYKNVANFGLWKIFIRTLLLIFRHRTELILLLRLAVA